MPSVEPVSSRFIGDPRLQRLLEDTHEDLQLAHDLFEWNVRAAGAAMEAIHVFELVLRNAIDRELRVWNQGMAGSSEWTLKPHPYLLRALNQSELDKASARARRIAADHGRSVSHDDVLAQMSLGVWRYILPSKSNRSKQKLWEVAIKNAFPAWPGDWTAESVVARVANVHGLRNRVAHLEPLHRHDLRRARRDMRSVCHGIGPDAARFFVQTERLLPTIDSNPVARPAEQSLGRTEVWASVLASRGKRLGRIDHKRASLSTSRKAVIPRNRAGRWSAKCWKCRTFRVQIPPSPQKALSDISELCSATLDDGSSR